MQRILGYVICCLLRLLNSTNHRYVVSSKPYTNSLEVYADHVALSFADILHLMNRRFTPTNQPGFAQSILWLTASFSDTCMKV